MNNNQDNIQRIKNIKKWIDISIGFGIVFGILAFSHGLWVFIYKKPIVVVYLYSQFPGIANGSIDIILGLTMLYFSILSLKNRRKLILHQFEQYLKEKKRIESKKESRKSLQNVLGINSKKIKNNMKISKRKNK